MPECLDDQYMPCDRFRFAVVTESPCGSAAMDEAVSADLTKAAKVGDLPDRRG